MIFNKKSLFVSFVVLIPWVGMVSGGITRINRLDLSFILMACLLFLYPFLVFLHSKTLDFVSSTPRESMFNSEVGMCFFIFLVLFYIIYISRLLPVLILFNYDLEAVRTYFFLDESSVDRIFFGVGVIKLIYWYVISPFVLSLFIVAGKWSKKEIFLLSLFLVANSLEGGRFAVYKIFLILLISKSFSCEQKIFDYKTVSFFSFLILCYFIVSFYRTSGVDFLGDSVFLKSTITKLYDYHSIQFGIIDLSSSAPMQFGIFTGLLTPVFILLGMSPPEGLLINYLGDIRFYTVDGDGPFNAFGTSIMYFYPLMSWLAIPVFFISIIIICMFFLSIKNNILRVNMTVFLLYSIFFSGFTPFMFGFIWWLLLLYVFFLSILTSHKANDSR